MLSDDMMAFFIGFLLDFDYGFNWKEVLQKAGWEVSEESWKRYVEAYDRNLPRRERPAPPEWEIPLMGAMDQERGEDGALPSLQEWLARMKMKERTVRLTAMCALLLCLMWLNTLLSASRAHFISWPLKYYSRMSLTT